jgi:hypothetical protein
LQDNVPIVVSGTPAPGAPTRSNAQ